ncbi:MAG: hypothetical protein GY715_06125 [Planctomycetes bacterium]|nr:hypothetical protein [Planctomycetota bacterium]
MRASLLVVSLASSFALAAIGGRSEAIDPAARTLLPPLAPVTAGIDGCFAASPTCARCHSTADRARAMKDASGRPVAPHDLWRSAMMANSSRDPLWRAMVSAEVARHPEAKAAIEAKCLRCHSPMASIEKQHATSTLALSELYDPDARHNQLALDGVSCTMCHQIEPGGLGAAKSFSGGFDIASEARSYGPHANPVPGPMRRFSRFTPMHGTHVTTSALCATCHTLTTHALDDDGAPTDHAYLEQSPYLEWRNSVYNDEIDSPRPEAASCQGCHVPLDDVDGTRIETRIARNPRGFDFPFASPRQPFGRHVFVGGNTLIPAILRDHPTELGTTAATAAFDATIAAARSQLRHDTARLEITPLEPTEKHRRFRVTVTNLSGHKFPTGHPTRRAWIRVEVRDRDGRSIFVSGAHDGQGRIVDGFNQLASDRVGGGFQPHHTVIDRAGQVQVYEAVMADANGDVTFSLMQATRNLKDNRLLPRGWSADHVHGAETAPVGVSDTDFLGGRDDVVYSVPTGASAGPWTVEVTLLYQVLGARFAGELLAWDTPEMRAFRRFYEATDRTPESVARATVLLEDPGRRTRR